ncbi:outer membrane protein assembly complex, YaeT protein [Spirochaeta thermophila DSM 6578]|uniref:Outer membrane protein assembly factor BamA n=1 Tax=Winmispira thermophila (strain ATCC 700085 / DSM 6578 / Z-1203) TaxID=869211 RepID=G0GE74_WINT7|nr:outer membrane protein assembly factor BamA [Spirochaeta thermophila]AEJ61427.1 outer membrane protein assembly complex, YaeT protein [Spirochaeta thermophila DSM 6578]
MRVTRRFIILLLSVVISLPLFAQEPPPDWYLGKPIKEFSFSGLSAVSENEIRGILRPYVGKTFTNDLFWEIQSKLYALEYFDEIIPSAQPADENYSAVIIHFEVKEFPSVDRITFEGNQRVRDSELLDTILLKRGDMVTQAKLRADERAIIELYHEKGFPEASVEGILREGDRGTEVVFVISEGPQIIVRSITFSGNLLYPEKTLRGLMKTKPQGFLVSGVYNEQTFQEDLRKIEDYYAQRGYIDARITHVEKTEEIEGDRHYLHITIYLSEGEQYRFGGITFEGNKIFSTERLQELFTLNEGDLFDRTAFTRDYQKLLDLYYENGYIFNRIDLREEKDPEQHLVSYHVTIEERGRAHIENIILRGNTKTKDFVILRELPIEEGDVFSKTKIVEGLRNLYNLQYFTSITPETPAGSTEGLMNLVINVEEAPTANIQFGVNFGGSSDFPVAATVAWSDQNFLGYGLDFGVNLTAAPNEQTLGFNYTDRWLFGKRWTGGVSLSISHKDTGRTIPQDTAIDGIVFVGNEENAVPDNGLYTGQWVDAETGELVPNPSQEQIDAGEVITDYEYARRNGFTIPEEYLMNYEAWAISFGINTGYRFYTPVGRLTPSTYFSTSLTTLDYDASRYRPFDPTTRENRGKWLFVNKWNLGISLDTRDIFYSPSSGYYLSQQLLLVGGFLGGSRHYIQPTTKLEGYLTLFDIPVAENWNFKWVLAAHTRLTYNLDQFWVPQPPTYQATSLDQLYVDGFFVGRGWSREPIGGGRTLWDNWIELRMPLLEQIMWWDFYFDFPAFSVDVTAPWDIPLENYRFGIGGGIRFVIPQFPLRFYIAKRFKVMDDKIEWQKGSLFPDSLGLDFVFTIGYDLY